MNQPTNSLSVTRRQRVVEDRWFAPFIISVLLIGYALSYLGEAFHDPIRSDGGGYYAFLPAWFIYADPTFESLAEQQYEGEIPSWTGIRRLEETGGYLNRYPPGLAILTVPFFAAAHAVTWLMQSPSGVTEGFKFNYPLDGYSFFYQHGAGLAGLFYVAAGLILLHRFLAGCFSVRTATWTVLTLLFGTNLLNYGTGETYVAHSAVFFLVVLLIRLVPWWHNEPLSIRRTWCIGLVVGLIGLVRPTSVIVGLIIPLFPGAGGLAKLIARPQLIRSYAMMAVVVGACLSLQLVVNWMSAGVWVFDGYGKQGYGFAWLRPKFLHVLFHFNHGAWLYAPVLCVAFFGFAVADDHVKRWRVPALTVVVLLAYIIASWWNWWFGGGCGHRGFIDVYPLLAIGLAGAVQTIRAMTLPARWVAWTILALMIGWSLFWVKLYYNREIPFEGLDGAAFFDIFWWRVQMIKAWFGG